MTDPRIRRIWAGQRARMQKVGGAFKTLTISLQEGLKSRRHSKDYIIIDLVQIYVNTRNLFDSGQKRDYGRTL